MSADFRQLHPLSAFLAPWLREGVPDLDALNHIAAARGILTGGGAPLRFVLPADDGEGYEERAWRRRLDQRLAAVPGQRVEVTHYRCARA